MDGRGERFIPIMPPLIIRAHPFAARCTPTPHFTAGPEPQPTSEAQLPQTPETASATWPPPPRPAAHPLARRGGSGPEGALPRRVCQPQQAAQAAHPGRHPGPRAGQFSKAQLSQFLRRHTGSTTYLVGITQAKTRFDLDGQPADEITDEHRSVAREELARRRGLQQERQALEDQQRRNRAQLLYDFERTTLTEGNFCALKGVSAEELPGLLEIARKERAEQPPEPAATARAHLSATAANPPRPPQRGTGTPRPRPKHPKPRENA